MFRNRCAVKEQSLLFDRFKAFDEQKSCHKSKLVFLFREDLFSFIRAQYVLYYHLIQVRWIKYACYKLSNDARWWSILQDKNIEKKEKSKLEKTEEAKSFQRIYSKKRLQKFSCVSWERGNIFYSNLFFYCIFLFTYLSSISLQGPFVPVLYKSY